MMNIFKNQNRMNIVGQGGKIILFTLPSLIAAVLAQSYFPKVAASSASLPGPFAPTARLARL